MSLLNLMFLLFNCKKGPGCATTFTMNHPRARRAGV